MFKKHPGIKNKQCGEFRKIMPAEIRIGVRMLLGILNMTQRDIKNTMLMQVKTLVAARH